MPIDGRLYGEGLNYSGVFERRGPMDTSHRALILSGTFAGLLAFHIWLLQRMVARGDTLLATLLVAAITMFAWRIVHYWKLYRRGPVTSVPEDPTVELRRIRTYGSLLAVLLPFHAWLLYQMILIGEILFSVLLLSAVVVFVYRLIGYAGRYLVLSRRESALFPVGAGADRQQSVGEICEPAELRRVDGKASEVGDSDVVRDANPAPRTHQ